MFKKTFFGQTYKYVNKTLFYLINYIKLYKINKIFKQFVKKTLKLLKPTLKST